MRNLCRLLIVLLILPIVSCSSEPTKQANQGSKDGPNPTKQKRVIGLSVLTLTNPFFKVIADEMTAEAKKNGFDVIVQSGEFDVAKQRGQVQNFIVQDVAAIVLCPCDSRAIGPVIKEANEAGIPVFTADIACTAEGAKVVTHIATDNYLGGKQAGQAMIEALGEQGGNILVLDYKEAESCQLRMKGFKEVLDAHNKTAKGPITIVQELAGDGKKAKSDEATLDGLSSHPDVVGIFAINDPSALGAYAALQTLNKTEQIKIIGFDGQPSGKQAIKEGKIYADPVQYPDKIGRKSVEMILKYLDGEEVPEVHLIPPSLYRKADADKDPSLN